MPGVMPGVSSAYELSQDPKIGGIDMFGPGSGPEMRRFGHVPQVKVGSAP
jgi:hypothetical protein